MRQQDIYCIVVDGSRLDDMVRTVLFQGAQILFNKKENGLAFTNEYCEGKITTKFDIRNVGYITGYLFEAEVDYGNNSTKVSYLCRELDFGSNDNIHLFSWKKISTKEIEDTSKIQDN